MDIIKSSLVNRRGRSKRRSWYLKVTKMEQSKKMFHLQEETRREGAVKRRKEGGGEGQRERRMLGHNYK